MKLILDHDAEGGYYLRKPSKFDARDREVDMPDADFQDYEDVERRRVEWQKRLDKLWEELPSRT
jgi:hypothetical protein